jgi:sugar lactone lactonase YvrE
VSTLLVDQVTDACAFHGEGPVWDGTRLRWVDMLNGEILALDADQSVSRRKVGTVVAALRPRASGGLVVALERGFALLDGEGDLTVLPELWSDQTVRMNDGGCDPQGRFYCGSMAYDAAAGRGSLYRLDPDGTVSTVLKGVTISNGIVWSLDGTEVFYVDSPTQRVAAYRFDPETGAFDRPRTVVEIPVAVGTPDGITLDAEGGLWVALWEGGAVHRYLPDGTLDAVVELPVSRVTACCFGGAALDELYITTSREGLALGEEPSAGALFRADVGVRGVPVHEYAG